MNRGKPVIVGLGNLAPALSGQHLPNGLLTDTEDVSNPLLGVSLPPHFPDYGNILFVEFRHVVLGAQMWLALASQHGNRMLNVLLRSCPFQVFRSVVAWVTVQVVGMLTCRTRTEVGDRDEMVDAQSEASTVTKKRDTLVVSGVNVWGQDAPDCSPAIRRCKALDTTKRRSGKESSPTWDRLPVFHVSYCITRGL